MQFAKKYRNVKMDINGGTWQGNGQNCAGLQIVASGNEYFRNENS